MKILSPREFEKKRIRFNKYQNARRKKLRDEKIVKLYQEKKLSTTKLAKRFYLSQNRIWAILQKHGVDTSLTDHPHNKIEFDEKELKRLYVDEEWTMDQLAVHFSVSKWTIHHRLKGVGVKSRPRGKRVKTETDK